MNREVTRAIELLNETHSFPGDYVFKLIGENTPHFYDRVMSEVSKELGLVSCGEYDVLTRRSAGLRYIAVTLRLRVKSAEQVLRLYDRFSHIEELRIMM